MDRYFEKISYEQFKKDIKDDINLYKSYIIPSRATKNSAGYDFTCLEEFVIKPGEVKKIPTGIKAKMLPDEMLQIYVILDLLIKLELLIVITTIIKIMKVIYGIVFKTMVKKK